MRSLILVLYCLLFCERGIAQVWVQKADFPEKKSASVSFMINDKIYVGGGYTNAQHFYEYNISSNSWKQLTDIPNSQNGRANAIAFTVNGKGYIGLGVDAVGGFFNDLYEYDVANNSWTKKASLPATGREGAGCFVLNNKAYVAGGAEVSRFPDVWCYDAVANNWTRKADYGDGPTIYPMAFSIKGKGYVTCGYTDNGDNGTYEYDPTANTWTRKASFPGDFRQAGIAMVLNDIAYCGLGQAISLFSAYNDMYAYNPAADSWTKVQDYPAGSRYYAVAASNGNKAFAGTGLVGTDAFENWYQFGNAPSHIDNRNHSCKFSIYPNPCSNSIQIQAGNIQAGQYFNYTIFDITGRVMLQGKSNSTVQLPGLSTGIYGINIDVNGVTSSNKFIVE